MLAGGAGLVAPTGAAGTVAAAGPGPSTLRFAGVHASAHASTRPPIELRIAACSHAALRRATHFDAETDLVARAEAKKIAAPRIDRATRRTTRGEVGERHAHLRNGCADPHRNEPMTTASIRLQTTLFAALTALTVACDEPGAAGPSAVALAPVEGLTVTAREDHVEGSFTRGDATIEFLLERDGGTRTAVLSASDGAPLLESIAGSGHETVTLFGGRAVLSGDPSAEPHVEGDPDAFAELTAMPEARAIAELHAALEEAGVDPVLLGAAPAADEVTPRLHFDGSYWNLDPGESVTRPTWAFATYTHVAMRVGKTHGANVPVVYACLWFRAGAGPWEQLCGTTGQDSAQARQFWGVSVGIFNLNPNVRLLVRTY